MAFLLPLLFIGAFVAYKVLPILLEPFLTPLRRIPGPPNASWLWGNLKEIREGSEPGGTTRKYLEKYGHVARYKLFLSVRIVILVSNYHRSTTFTSLIGS